MEGRTPDATGHDGQGADRPIAGRVTRVFERRAAFAGPVALDGRRQAPRCRRAASLRAAGRLLGDGGSPREGLRRSRPVLGTGLRRWWARVSGIFGSRPPPRQDRQRRADRHGHHHRGLRPARASSTASATTSASSGPTASRHPTSTRTSAAPPPAPGASRSRPAMRCSRASARSEARPYQFRSAPLTSW